MEPEDGGSALTVTSFDNVALVWTRKCLGLYDTVCTFQLHRIALPDGTDTVVAVSPDPPVSALSPDHRRIAIGTRSGIFVKDLP